MINEKSQNLCETCEFVDFTSLVDKEGKECRGFSCPYAQEHSYRIDTCNHYSNPSALQKFLRSRFSKVLIFVCLIGVFILFAMFILKR